MGKVYRVCKAFEVESGHMLSKHPARCRHPHGHTRRVEVVIASDRLDEHDMVCDFHAIKLAVADALDQLDHAMAINSADPKRDAIEASSERVVIFEDEDPTTEAMARRIHDHLEDAIRSGREMQSPRGGTCALPSHLRVERVRVGETSTSWAEYGEG